MKRIMKILREKKGSFSLEAVIAMTMVLFVTFLGIAYFVYLAPKQVLTQNVHMLAQTAKIQGGLTDETSEPGQSDVERFKERLEAKGFDADNVVVDAYREAPGKTRYTALGVEPISADVGNYGDVDYSRRNSKETITINVTVPAKLSFIGTMSSFFSGKETTLGDYHFSETIMSERW